jgi:hypothetical protein
VSAAHAQAEREREAQREQEATSKPAGSPDRSGGPKTRAPLHARDAGAAGGSKLPGGLLRAVLPTSSRGRQSHLSDEDADFDTAPLPRLTASGAIASPEVNSLQPNGAVKPGHEVKAEPVGRPEREHPAGRDRGTRDKRSARQGRAARQERERAAAEERARQERDSDAEERVRQEKERAAQLERERKAAEERAAEERARQEKERAVAEERSRQEQERAAERERAAEERTRLEQERAAQERTRQQEERARQERERAAQLERERAAAEERARQEQERTARREERHAAKRERIAQREQAVQQKRVAREELARALQERAREERERVAQERAERERARLEEERAAQERARQEEERERIRWEQEREDREWAALKRARLERERAEQEVARRLQELEEQSGKAPKPERTQGPGTQGPGTPLPVRAAQPDRTPPPAKAAQPEPTPQPAPAPPPASATQPKPTPQPESAPPERAARPEPAPQPDPVPVPASATQRKPTPQPEATPATVRAVQPKPTPQPDPTPATVRAAQPDPTPSPEGTPQQAERRLAAVSPAPEDVAARSQPLAQPKLSARETPGVREITHKRRYRGPAIVAAAAVLVAAGWLIFERPAAHPSGHAATHAPKLSAAQITMATRDEAAAWVARQISSSATVSCDPVMCSALKAHGVQNVLTLEPKASDPAGSIVVATALIRSEFASVATYAPAVIASFGTGNARIDIRQAAPDGPAAFQKALQTDLQQRKQVENSLDGNLQIVASSTARRQLADGQVDARLSELIEAIAGTLPQPVHILSFGDLGPGATAGIPLRSATLIGSVATLRATLAFALGQTGLIHPSRAQLATLDGQRVLIVEFTAPIPLELFNP